MDSRSEISSSEDEFHFTLLQNKIKQDYIHDELSDTENESSDGDGDIVLGIRNRKTRVRVMLPVRHSHMRKSSQVATSHDRKSRRAQRVNIVLFH